MSVRTARTLALYARRRRRARLAVRAALTAKLAGLPCWQGLALEACWSSGPAAVDEAMTLALTLDRIAAAALEAAALDCEPDALLAAVLVGRAVVEELEPAGGEG